MARLNQSLAKESHQAENRHRFGRNKLIPLKINHNILRSETAAISMISIISFNMLS